VGVVFWKTSICLWRSSDGSIHAVEDRCAHRQLRLSAGLVMNDHLTCCYHGWEYDGEGRVVRMAHEIPKSFRSTPHVQIRTYPVREKYGMVFVWPGDPSLADEAKLPAIEWLDQAEAVPFKFVDISVKAHFSLIIENNCDFYHAFLHRKYKPFVWPELRSVEAHEEKVIVKYWTDMGQSSGAKVFSPADMNDMTLWCVRVCMCVCVCPSLAQSLSLFLFLTTSVQLVWTNQTNKQRPKIGLTIPTSDRI
jgi:phenylpropionate dioxygenase-like ring-hydroxylating dioxygenase large terminal subunit